MSYVTKTDEIAGWSNPKAIILKDVGIVFIAAISIMVIMFSYWQYSSSTPLNSYPGIYVVSWLSVILGGLLGWRTRRLEITLLISTAVGVAWRISVVWIVLMAAIEYVFKDEIFKVQDQFPELLLKYTLLITGMFILGHVTNVARGHFLRSVRGIKWGLNEILALLTILATLIQIILSTVPLLVNNSAAKVGGSIDLETTTVQNMPQQITGEDDMDKTWEIVLMKYKSCFGDGGEVDADCESNVLDRY